MKKQILSMLLVCVMLFSVVACNAGPDDDQTTQAPTETTAQPPVDTTTAAPEETAPVRDVADLPDQYDLDGFNLRILIMQNAANAGAMATLAPDALNAEILNDAMFERNAAMKEKYNFEMTNIEASNVLNTMTNSILAQEDAYDVALPYFNTAIAKISEGYFVDLTTLPHLNLEKNYWDQNFNESTSFFDKQYFAVGDLMVADDDVLLMFMYNSALGKDLGVENLYTAVEEGRWTYELMTKYAQSANNDLNGDSVMDDKDRYGYFWASNNCIFPHFAATGTSLMIRDENDMPVLNKNLDKVYAVWDIVYDLLDQDRNSIDWTTFKDQKAGIISMISGKQVLFQNMILSQVRRLYRDIPTDFGLLPMPKYDEKQDTYYSSIWKSFSTLCVPTSNTHQAETGFVIEALAAASEEINPAYYDVCLASKYTRDPESSAMIELTRQNVIYDLAWIYDWGKLGTSINTAAAKREGQLATVYDSFSLVAQNEATAFAQKQK